MTRDDIIRMAREAGFEAAEYGLNCTSGMYAYNMKIVERFAAHVAAAEREACARVCEDEAEKWEGDDGPISTEARLCALHIRARGTS